MNQKNWGSVKAETNVIYAGMTKFFNTYAGLFKIDSDFWILDSGASECMTFDRSFFTNLNIFSKFFIVILPNSHKVKITYSGYVSLLNSLAL